MASLEVRRQRARSLSDAVKCLRRELHVSQEEFARQAGVSVRTVKAWEEGRISNPRYASMRSVSARLGRPISYFLGEAA